MQSKIHIKMKLLLIDAYALIYRSYYAFIRNPRINSKGFNTSAIFGFINSMEDVLKRLEPTHVAVGFDPSGPTFRHEAYEEYKSQREETPEDIRKSVPIIRQIIEAYHIPILEVPKYEADDTIGTVAHQAEKEGFEVYMMTSDKDYAQLVKPNVYQYRPKFGGDYEVLGVPEVLEKYALSSPLQMIDLLGLMGDSSDNIPGAPGVGEKTAQKLLAEFESIENLLEHTDQLKGKLKEKIEENAELIRFSKFLATIVTDVPIQFDAKASLRQEPDQEALKEIYTELEFRTFISRMEQQKPAEKVINRQLSLFDEPNDSVEDTVSIATDLQSMDTVKPDYQLIDTEEAIQKLADRLSKEQSFAFDTETDGIDPIEASIIGLSIAIRPNEAYYIPLLGKQEEITKKLAPFKPVFENETIEKVGQNIKFDLLVLRKQGIYVKGKLYDTMIAHYLLNPELRHNMDYLAETYLNYKTIPIEELIGPKGKGQRSMREVPIDKVVPYAAEDADITLKLKEYFEPLVAETTMNQLFNEVEMPLVYVLADMEATGIKLDTEALKLSSETLTAELITLEKEITELAGETFNINSTKQVGEILFDKLKIEEKAKKTKTGSYSTSEEVLIKLKGKHPIVQKILDYRGVKKLLSTYVDALPKLINPHTGKIHTSFNQTVTATGRLSSTNPNLQNIPIRDDIGREIRRAFVPDQANCLFLSADYSQIELRIMAHLSEDPHMIEAFQQGKDIHASTAAKIYGIAIDEVTKDMRRKAKTANFGIIYGISVFGLSERLNIPRREAKELIDGYFNSYEKVKEYMDASVQRAKENGYVETIFHRRRYLPDINSHNSIVRGYAERNAINAPIQGSAADIIKLAMVRIFNRMTNQQLKSKMILQVHDELNFNVYPDELELVQEIVTQEMQEVISLKVPLIAECGVGNNWLEAH